MASSSSSSDECGSGLEMHCGWWEHFRSQCPDPAQEKKQGVRWGAVTRLHSSFDFERVSLAVILLRSPDEASMAMPLGVQRLALPDCDSYCY